jgi:hypothetical protein
MDLSNFSVISSDDYHPAAVECAACTALVVEEDSIRVNELLDRLNEHCRVCIPKKWQIERCHGTGEYRYWTSYFEPTLTDAEKLEKEKTINTEYERIIPRKY